MESKVRLLSEMKSSTDIDELQDISNNTFGNCRNNSKVMKDIYSDEITAK